MTVTFCSFFRSLYLSAIERKKERIKIICGYLLVFVDFFVRSNYTIKQKERKNERKNVRRKKKKKRMKG